MRFAVHWRMVRAHHTFQITFIEHDDVDAEWMREECLDTIQQISCADTVRRLPRSPWERPARQCCRSLYSWLKITRRCTGIQRHARPSDSFICVKSQPPRLFSEACRQ